MRIEDQTDRVAHRQERPLSPNEAALFAAIDAIVRSTPGGPQRKMLFGLLNTLRDSFIAEGQPQSAALINLLAAAAETGPA